MFPRLKFRGKYDHAIANFPLTVGKCVYGEVGEDDKQRINPFKFLIVFPKGVYCTITYTCLCSDLALFTSSLYRSSIVSYHSLYCLALFII